MDILRSDIKIAADIKTLAAQLAEVIDTEWVVIGLMDGAMIFAADLLRQLYHAHNINPQFESLTLSSYGDAHESSGQVICLKDIRRDLSGRNILIIDDVYESGLTLAYAVEYIRAKGAKNIMSCVFARKPYHGPQMEMRAQYDPNFVAWDAPKRFLIGYGLDDKAQYRGLPFIAALD